MAQDVSGWTQSAPGWIRQVDTFDFAREILLDGPMLQMCGPLEGARVLDVGCGEGRFCRMLRNRGATTVGLDPTDALLSVAKGRDPDGTYVSGVGESMPFEDASFDIVVSYLTLLDIEDFRTAIKECVRVLKPGGRFVYGNLAAFATTTGHGWVHDAAGKKSYFPIDYYIDERAMEVAWRDIKVINYHRPLSAYVTAFLNEGLLLKEFVEPAPTLEQVAEHPDWMYERRVPYCMGMLWAKPK